MSNRGNFIPGSTVTLDHWLDLAELSKMNSMQRRMYHAAQLIKASIDHAEYFSMSEEDKMKLLSVTLEFSRSEVRGLLKERGRENLSKSNKEWNLRTGIL